MRRVSVSQITLAFGVAVLLLGHQAAQAEDVDFVVKQATYSGTGGVFRCEAKLAAGDTATVTLTVPEEHADHVFGSIHTSFPAKLSRAPPSSDKVVITVSVESSSAVTAGITYHTQFEVAASYSIRYGIQRLAEETEQAKLNGYLHVHDRSASNAQWSEAKLLIKRPTLNDICRTNVIMGAGQTYISPLAKLVRYAVKLAAPEPNYLRTLGDAAYEVQQLTNSGDQTLAPGIIRVMSEAGSFLYGAELEESLEGKSTADLRIAQVPTVEVSVTETDGRWHEAVSVDHGVLKYRTWSIKETTINNKQGAAIQIFVEGITERQTIEPGKSPPLFGSDGDQGAEAFADLFDLSKAKLELHVAKLKEFQVFGKDVKSVDVSDVQKIQESILNLMTGIDTLAASIDITVARIADLVAAGADTNVITFYQARKDNLTKRRDDNKDTLKEKIVELATKLKDMDPASDSMEL